ncbi:hypothetical protein LQL77_32685, partial [Rhodococcus cerastii]|nr:hypothetical protein [Rhodococcus cerastii]
HIDDTPIDKPLQVHIASHEGVEWGENFQGWKPRVRNLTGQNLWKCRGAVPPYTCDLPPGTDTALTTTYMMGFSSGLETPLPFDLSVTDSSPSEAVEGWLRMYFETDAFGRTHHRCSATNTLQCSVIPSNDDDQGHKQ